MARLRFPGRPGQRFGRLGVKYGADEARKKAGTTSTMVDNIHRGLKYFYELFGESEEEDEFEGFSRKEFKKARNKFNKLLETELVKKTDKVREVMTFRPYAVGQPIANVKKSSPKSKLTSPAKVKNRAQHERKDPVKSSKFSFKVKLQGRTSAINKSPSKGKSSSKSRKKSDKWTESDDEILVPSPSKVSIPKESKNKKKVTSKTISSKILARVKSKSQKTKIRSIDKTPPTAAEPVADATVDAIPGDKEEGSAHRITKRKFYAYEWVGPGQLEKPVVVDGKRERKPSSRLLMKFSDDNFNRKQEQTGKVEHLKRQGANILQKAKLNLNKAALNRSKAALCKSLGEQMKKDAKLQQSKQSTGHPVSFSMDKSPKFGERPDLSLSPVRGESTRKDQSTPTKKPQLGNSPPTSPPLKLAYKKKRCNVCQRGFNDTVLKDMYYGVVVCRSCRTFHRKNIAQGRHIKPSKDCRGHCTLSKLKCASCREQKAILMLPSLEQTKQMQAAKVHNFIEWKRTREISGDSPTRQIYDKDIKSPEINVDMDNPINEDDFENVDNDDSFAMIDGDDDSDFVEDDLAMVDSDGDPDFNAPSIDKKSPKKKTQSGVKKSPQKKSSKTKISLEENPTCRCCFRNLLSTIKVESKIKTIKTYQGVPCCENCRSLFRKQYVSGLYGSTFKCVSQQAGLENSCEEYESLQSRCKRCRVKKALTIFSIPESFIPSEKILAQLGLTKDILGTQEKRDELLKDTAVFVKPRRPLPTDLNLSQKKTYQKKIKMKPMASAPVQSGKYQKIHTDPKINKLNAKRKFYKSGKMECAIYQPDMRRLPTRPLSEKDIRTEERHLERIRKGKKIYKYPKKYIKKKSPEYEALLKRKKLFEGTTRMDGLREPCVCCKLETVFLYQDLPCCTACRKLFGKQCDKRLYGSQLVCLKKRDNCVGYSAQKCRRCRWLCAMGNFKIPDQLMPTEHEMEAADIVPLSEDFLEDFDESEFNKAVDEELMELGSEFGSEHPSVGEPTIDQDTSQDSIPESPEAGSVPGRGGPRIKHVCRKASVALGTPATFPLIRPELCLSALPSSVKDQMAQDVVVNKTEGIDSDDSDALPLEEIINRSADNRTEITHIKSPTGTGTPRQSRRNVKGTLFTKTGGIRKRAGRCGDCKECMAPPCGKCIFCLDRPKFGGSNKLKKCCVDRVCRSPLQAKSTKSSSVSTNEKYVTSKKAVTAPGPNGSGTRVSTRVKESVRYLDDFVSDAESEDSIRSSATNLSGHSQYEPPTSKDVLMKATKIGGRKPTKMVETFQGDKYAKKDAPMVLQSVVKATKAWSNKSNQMHHKIKVDFQEDYDIDTAWRRGLSLISSTPFCVRTVCFLCASAGQHQLVYCNVCCEPFHTFCLEDHEKPKKGNLENWCCRRCQCCNVCGKPNKLLECDKCKDTYHAECLGPCYPTKPSKNKNIWVCTKCVRCKSCGATTPGKTYGATWMYDFSLCFECGQLMDKGNFCPLCHKCYSDDDWDCKMVQCARCDSWVHAKCENLSDEMYQMMSYLPEEIPYICTACVPEKPAKWEVALRQEMIAGCTYVLTTLLNSRCAQHLVHITEEQKSKSKCNKTKSEPGDIKSTIENTSKRKEHAVGVRRSSRFTSDEKQEVKDTHMSKVNLTGSEVGVKPEDIEVNVTSDSENENIAVTEEKGVMENANRSEKAVKVDNNEHQNVLDDEDASAISTSNLSNNQTSQSESQNTLNIETEDTSDQSEFAKPSDSVSKDIVSKQLEDDISNLSDTQELKETNNENLETQSEPMEVDQLGTTCTNEDSDFGTDGSNAIHDNGDVIMEASTEEKPDQELRCDSEDKSKDESNSDDISKIETNEMLNNDTDDGTNIADLSFEVPLDIIKETLGDLTDSVIEAVLQSEDGGVEVVVDNIPGEDGDPTGGEGGEQVIVVPDNAVVDTLPDGTTVVVLPGDNEDSETTDNGIKDTLADTEILDSESGVQTTNNHVAMAPDTRDPSTPEKQVIRSTFLPPPPQKEHPSDFNSVKSKLINNQYKLVEDFADDLVFIIQDALKTEETATKKKFNNAVRSIFTKEMAKCFPWFNVNTEQLWQQNKNYPSDMLPEAVLPPSEDHTYAQWLSRNKSPHSPHPSPFKRVKNTPVKWEFSTDSDTPVPAGNREDVRKCNLCGEYGDAMPNDAGRLLYMGGDDWTHTNCALWSAEVYEEVDGSLQQVYMAIARGKKLRCAYCDKSGATVGCCAAGCKANYHFMCARKAGCIFLEDKKVFCKDDTSLVDGQTIVNGRFKVMRRVCIDMSTGFLNKPKSYMKQGLAAQLVNLIAGSMTIECLGTLTPSSDCKRSLYPVDFSCSRVFWSTKDARRRAVYTCKIIEVKPDSPSTPEFFSGDHQTIVHDDNEEVIDDMPAPILKLGDIQRSVSIGEEDSLKSEEDAENEVLNCDPTNDLTTDLMNAPSQSYPMYEPFKRFKRAKSMDPAIEERVISQSWGGRSNVKPTKPSPYLDLTGLSPKTLKQLNLVDAIKTIKNEVHSSPEKINTLMRVAETLNVAAVRNQIHTTDILNIRRQSRDGSVGRQSMDGSVGRQSMDGSVGRQSREGSVDKAALSLRDSSVENNEINSNTAVDEAFDDELKSMYDKIVQDAKKIQEPVQDHNPLENHDQKSGAVDGHQPDKVKQDGYQNFFKKFCQGKESSADEAMEVDIDENIINKNPSTCKDLSIQPDSNETPMQELKDVSECISDKSTHDKLVNNDVKLLTESVELNGIDVDSAIEDGPIGQYDGCDDDKPKNAKAQDKASVKVDNSSAIPPCIVIDTDDEDSIPNKKAKLVNGETLKSLKKETGIKHQLNVAHKEGLTPIFNSDGILIGHKMNPAASNNQIFSKKRIISKPSSPTPLNLKNRITISKNFTQGAADSAKAKQPFRSSTPTHEQNHKSPNSKQNDGSPENRNLFEAFCMTPTKENIERKEKTGSEILAVMRSNRSSRSSSTDDESKKTYPLRRTARRRSDDAQARQSAKAQMQDLTKQSKNSLNGLIPQENNQNSQQHSKTRGRSNTGVDGPISDSSSDIEKTLPSIQEAEYPSNDMSPEDAEDTVIKEKDIESKLESSENVKASRKWIEKSLPSVTDISVENVPSPKVQSPQRLADSERTVETTVQLAQTKATIMKTIKGRSESPLTVNTHMNFPKAKVVIEKLSPAQVRRLSQQPEKSPPLHDKIARKITEESMSKSLSLGGPFKCPTCKRKYRTPASLLKHAEQCDFNVSSSDEDEEVEDESGSISDEPEPKKVETEKDLTPLTRHSKRRPKPVTMLDYDQTMESQSSEEDLEPTEHVIIRKDSPKASRIDHEMLEIAQGNGDDEDGDWMPTASEQQKLGFKRVKNLQRTPTPSETEDSEITDFTDYASDPMEEEEAIAEPVPDLKKKAILEMVQRRQLVEKKRIEIPSTVTYSDINVSKNLISINPNKVHSSVSRASTHPSILRPAISNGATVREVAGKVITIKRGTSGAATIAVTSASTTIPGVTSGATSIPGMTCVATTVPGLTSGATSSVVMSQASSTLGVAMSASARLQQLQMMSNLNQEAQNNPQSTISPVRLDTSTGMMANSLQHVNAQVVNSQIASPPIYPNTQITPQTLVQCSQIQPQAQYQNPMIATQSIIASPQIQTSVIPTMQIPTPQIQMMHQMPPTLNVQSVFVDQKGTRYLTVKGPPGVNPLQYQLAASNSVLMPTVQSVPISPVHVIGQNYSPPRQKSPRLLPNAHLETSPLRHNLAQKSGGQVFKVEPPVSNVQQQTNSDMLKFVNNANKVNPNIIRVIQKIPSNTQVNKGRNTPTGEVSVLSANADTAGTMYINETPPSVCGRTTPGSGSSISTESCNTDTASENNSVDMAAQRDDSANEVQGSATYVSNSETGKAEPKVVKLMVKKADQMGKAGFVVCTSMDGTSRFKESAMPTKQNSLTDNIDGDYSNIQGRLTPKSDSFTPGHLNHGLESLTPASGRLTPGSGRLTPGSAGRLTPGSGNMTPEMTVSPFDSHMSNSNHMSGDSSPTPGILKRSREGTPTDSNPVLSNYLQNTKQLLYSKILRKNQRQESNNYQSLLPLTNQKMLPEQQQEKSAIKIIKRIGSDLEPTVVSMPMTHTQKLNYAVNQSKNIYNTNKQALQHHGYNLGIQQHGQPNKVYPRFDADQHNYSSQNVYKIKKNKLEKKHKKPKPANKIQVFMDANGVEHKFMQKKKKGRPKLDHGLHDLVRMNQVKKKADALRESNIIHGINGPHTSQPKMISPPTSLPPAATEEEVTESPLYTIFEHEEKVRRQEALARKDSPYLIFDIRSDDGFHVQSSNWSDAWNAVLERVQDARASAHMKQLSMQSLDRLGLFGLSHDAVVYLIEQLYGAKYCRNYKFLYHHYDHKDTSEMEVVEVENPTGCARSEPFISRKPFEMFSFLLSKYRIRPSLRTEGEKQVEKMLQTSQKRATSLDLPVGMRYRHLQQHSKEAVGAYRSSIHGRGLYCKRDIDAGEMVIEYAGEVIRSILTDKREEYYESKGIGCYMFRIDDYDVIDATRKGTAARFINHSCDPNCYSKVINVDGKKHIVIFASRPIMRGEELTYDYKFPIEDVKIPCLCGAKKCRHYLN